MLSILTRHPAGICLLNVNNKNTKMLNMFKVNNKNTTATPLALFWYLYC